MRGLTVALWLLCSLTALATPPGHVVQPAPVIICPPVPVQVGPAPGLPRPAIEEPPAKVPVGPKLPAIEEPKAKPKAKEPTPVQPAPPSPGPVPVERESKSLEYSVYAVPGRDGSVPPGKRTLARVDFWNHAKRPLTLRINDTTHTLIPGKSLRLTLDMPFQWGEVDQPPRIEKLPADAVGLDIVIRR